MLTVVLMRETPRWTRLFDVSNCHFAYHHVEKSVIGRSKVLLCDIYKRIGRSTLCGKITMEAEDEVVNNTDVATSLSKKCDICARMGPDENKLLTEYVVKLTKDHTLSSMIQEIASFAQNLYRRDSDKRSDRLEQSGLNPSSCVHSDDAIARHVMFCIAPREATVRMIICNSVLMNLLNDAKSSQDTAIAVKLLLQTQAAEKRI